jgi:hypothetical protein
MLKYQSAILSIHLIPLRAQSAGTGCVCYDHKPKVAAFQNPPSTMTLHDVSFGTLRYISAAMLFLLLLKTNLSKTPVSGPYLAEEHYVRASVNELDTPATTNRTNAPKLSLHLIGERHSGTKWMSEYLQICFPSVDFSNNPFRWKHWFQDETLPDKHGGTRLVVVAQFRHPYAWTESSKLAFQPPSSQHHIPLSSPSHSLTCYAVRTLPYHSPEHFHLPWKEFVDRAWVVARQGKDLKYANVTKADEDIRDTWCTSALFRPYQVIPCMANRSTLTSHGVWTKALYELKNDGTGEAYDSILELRSDKIDNFLSVEKFNRVHAFFPVKYEDMKRLGTVTLLRNLERELGVRAMCDTIHGDPTFRDRAIPKNFRLMIISIGQPKVELGTTPFM